MNRTEPLVRRPKLLAAPAIMLLAASLLLSASGIHAQAIFGSVKTFAGVPVEGVQVRGIRSAPLQVVTTTTDFSGGYVLGAGLSGTYQVQAVEIGYTFTPASTNVSISGSSVRLDFTTPATAPTVTTLSATNVLADNSTLEGSVRPNGTTTVAWFDYGPTTGYGSVSSSVIVGSGNNFAPVSRLVGNLLNGATYHFRVVASNSFGVRLGSDMTFTTRSGIPSVTALAPTDGGATTMRLNGLVNPNGATTMGWFEVGTTTNYGNPAVLQNLGNGTNATVFSQTLVGLTPGTIYHHRAVAASSVGTNYGADLLFSPAFSYSGRAVTPTTYNGIGWGDFDNDGRPDILLAGSATEVWRNTGSAFTNLNAGLPYAADGAVAPGDYDNDGRLDILLTGWVFPNVTTSFTRVYRNLGNGTFTDINAGLPALHRSAAAWGDCDNDGHLDVLLAGLNANTNPIPITKVWRNAGTGFVPDGTTPLPGVARGAVAWGDYDNDGRLDLVLTGSTTAELPFQPITQIWRNTGAGFSNINARLPGVSGWNNRSAVAWGDYDADGRLDLVLAGTTNGDLSGGVCQVWHNTSTGFVLNTNAPLTGVSDSSLVWGDYDNDGRLDVLLTGYQSNFAYATEVWRNTGSGFVNIGAGLPGLADGAAAWGDYDNDGRLDLVITGSGQIWRNNSPATNSPPAAPSGLMMSVSNFLATLTWSASADDTTPAAGLTYNVRVGTTPGGSDVLTPASAANGFRRVPQLGNAQSRLSTSFKFTSGTAYYWSVQAVDGALAGSPFAPEQSFKFLAVPVPPAATSVAPGDLDADGIVNQPELNAVLANYWLNSPWLQMTNPMKLPDGGFQFALTNASSWNFSVLVSTNLLDWEPLGSAFPVYQFLDQQATNAPQRHYRLRWP